MRARAHLIRFVGLTLTVIAVATPTAQIGLSPPPAPELPNLGKLDPLLLARATLTTGQSRIVATAPAAVSVDSLSLLIQQVGGTVGRRLRIINGVAATVPNVSFLALSACSRIQQEDYVRGSAGSMERYGPRGRA